ncbi:hypothetical protein C1646_774333 [Rhizophagus diaphanus]|nr:hypothetical protein C1646_774333 [Rhizophagus diaphanus] [Rhizophagus sp. MUCL 43196]
MSYEKWDLLKILANHVYHSPEMNETEDEVPPDDASDWSFIEQPNIVYYTEYIADDDDLNFDDDELDAILANKKDTGKNQEVLCKKINS